MKKFLFAFVLTLYGFATAAPLVYEGADGPGKGKHIVFIAGDHEYRSEETLPELARIMAHRLGFKCTVLFDIDPANGEIVAGTPSNIPGMEALDTADLAVVFLRFQDLPAEQMKHFDAYIKRGGPVVGLRTATHAFSIKKGEPFAEYSYNNKDAAYLNGFGEQVLGQTWVGHYGKNHTQSTRIAINPALAQNPILSGVKDVWVQAGAYVGKPISGEILTTAQPLNGMTPESPIDATKPPQPSEWTRTYKSASGKEGRAFTTLYGTSDDITNEGYRRLVINGMLWAIGMEKTIKPDLNINFVGPFDPNNYGGGAYARGVKPEMYTGFDSPIPANHNTKGEDKKEPKAPKKVSAVQPAPAATPSTASAPTAALATGAPARYVRIELPGEKRILTLAEVEVFSGGKNIAPSGKATQSSTYGGAGAERAIDGNKSPDFGKKGQTHTSNSGETNPWWELDLASPQAIDKIAVWNRRGFESRLDGFTLTLLDANHKEVFRAVKLAAPESMEIDVKNQGKLTYLTFEGKPGSAAANSSSSKSAGGKKAAASEPEPTLVEVPADYHDKLPFSFHKSDVIAILGDGLSDRMQHDGWMETLLQSQLAAEQVRFRTMSVSGDRPNSYPRSQGATKMTDYLRHVKADVVFAFFGYNDSYAGANKADEYKAKLIEFVRRTRGAKPDGKDFPRIVLFSPIAHEDTHNPNVPNGVAHNAELEAYTKATEAAAKEAGVGFVDLFHPSLELYKAAKSPLTINGVHLTEEGNRQLAEVIASSLLGKRVSYSASLDPLREAVLDKNFNWYNRYHAADGNDVWGSRSTLSFVNKQTNADVLQHELIMLDVRTANRDERIWARITGGDKKIDDSNVPPPVPVISNVGGGSKSSNAMKEGVLTYTDGEEAIKKMAVAKGFKIELFADEKRFPQLVNPVQIHFDTKGRLWAAVWPTYPKWEPGKPMNDALLVFNDDGHGHATGVTEFANIQDPLGFEFWNNGVLVTRQSELLYLKDTNGDDKADVQTIMLQGLDTADTHHGANNLTYGPDGGIYWQSGVFMQHNYEHPWGPSLQASASAMYRFDPRRFTIAMHAGNSPNPHGTSFDYWGYEYATDGTSGRAFQVRPEKDGFKMYELLKKEVRPVTSNLIVSSAQFPESMQGDLLICNVIGFLGLKQYHLDRNAETGAVWGEPDGDSLSVQVTNADGSVAKEEARGFMMSGDKNFRPSCAAWGPDGSLYIADWQNVIIGHMQHNVRDPNRDHGHGRIYRITAIDRPLAKPVAIAGQPIPALLDNLKSPIDDVRHRTHIELSGRDSKEVVAATHQWIKQWDPNKKEDAHHLLEALWVLEQHNVRDYALLANLQKSPELHVHHAAATAQQLWMSTDDSTHGGVVANAEEAKAQKSGILSDTPDLTTVRIGTVPERMSYDVKEIPLKAGKKIKLIFVNPDFMPHNLVIVNPGKIDEIANQALVLGPKGFELGFVPESSEILKHTKLLDHGNEEVIEFTAPAKPGDYPYMCSFPGHSIIMRGVFKVR